MSKRVGVLILVGVFFPLCGAFRSFPSGVRPGRVDRPATPQPAAARGHPDPPPAGGGGGLRRQQRGAQRPQLLPTGDLIFPIERERACTLGATHAYSSTQPPFSWVAQRLWMKSVLFFWQDLKSRCEKLPLIERLLFARQQMHLFTFMTEN